MKPVFQVQNYNIFKAVYQAIQKILIKKHKLYLYIRKKYLTVAVLFAS